LDPHSNGVSGTVSGLAILIQASQNLPKTKGKIKNLMFDVFIAGLEASP
jgi:hypothetical protein